MRAVIKKILTVWYLVRDFLSGRPLQTVYINFKCLPLKQAIRLPIFIYSTVVFRNIYMGGVVIDCQHVKPNMIKFGRTNWYPVLSKPQTILNIEGKLILKGPLATSGGIYLLVAKNATLSIGTGGTFIGCGTKIFCYNSVTIGNNCQITWDVQIMDTSFHYVRDVEGNAKRLDSAIVIGDNCWIGNRTTVCKGTVLPEYSIVASNSLINKDYSKFEGHVLFAGCPAEPKLAGITRVFSSNEEAELDRLYNYNRTHI